MRDDTTQTPLPNATKVFEAGTLWPAYRVGIGRTERRSEDGRCAVRLNVGATTYSASVKDSDGWHTVGRRYLSARGAMRAARKAIGVEA